MSKAHRVSAYLEFEIDDAAYSSLCDVHRRLSEATQPFVALKALQSLDLTGVKWRTTKGEPIFRGGEKPELWVGPSIGWLEFDRTDWKQCRKDWLPILHTYSVKRANEVTAAFKNIVDRQIEAGAVEAELGTRKKSGPEPKDYSLLQSYVEAVRADIANGLPLKESLKVRSKEYDFDRNSWLKDTARLRGYRGRQSKRMG